jgi:hypothetical protein
MGERADIFGGADFDVSGFTPAKPAKAPPPAPVEAVRKVAEQAEFSSREPQRRRAKREPRCYRTGRNALFSIKADPDVVEEFYAIAQEQGWVLGLTLEHAVAALRKEVAAKGRGGKG